MYLKQIIATTHFYLMRFELQVLENVGVLLTKTIVYLR